MPNRTANATWEGNLKEGFGTVRTGSGQVSTDLTFDSRFEQGGGSNPEELIAAAHAGCFSMALSAALSKAGHPPQKIETTAEVELAKTDDGFAIPSILLTTKASVPGIDSSEFMKLANQAKENCPVSKALAGTKIRLDAKLSG